MPPQGVPTSWEPKGTKHLGCASNAEAGCYCKGVPNQRCLSVATTRAEKLQIAVFLPNEMSSDGWYAGVYALPTVWPDV